MTELEKELADALRQLFDACQYVSPIVGAVATRPSVQEIRRAGKFVEACEIAEAALAKIRS